MNLYLQPLKVEVAANLSHEDSKVRERVLSSAGPEQGLEKIDRKGSEGALSLFRNQSLLERYLSGRRLAKTTRDSYGTSLKSFNDLVGVPLEEAGRHDLEEWFARASSKGLAASSIHLYAYRLRNLLEYALVARGLNRRDAVIRLGEAMEGVPLLDLRREMRLRQPGREKLVRPHEVSALMNTAKHPRTQALIAVLFESGCRKGELVGLRVGDVSFGKNYAEIRVLGKTGERTIPLVRSIKYLKAWMEAHPDPRPNAPLFATIVSGSIRRMSIKTPNRLLYDLCERADLRRITPHMLRHTRLTELARKGLGDYQLKSFAGWTPDSKMAARYIHLSGRAHIPAVLAADGLISKHDEEEAEG